MALDTWERPSHMVTAVGPPFAIFVFLWGQHRERMADEEELRQRLSENDAEFAYDIRRSTNLIGVAE